MKRDSAQELRDVEPASSIEADAFSRGDRPFKSPGLAIFFAGDAGCGSCRSPRFPQDSPSFFSDFRKKTVFIPTY